MTPDGRGRLDGGARSAWRMPAPSPSLRNQQPSVARTNVAEPGVITYAAVLSALLASVGGFLFGFDIGYIGPIEGFAGFQNSVNGGRPIESHMRGLITGIFSLGAVLACLPPLSCRYCDGLGRRYSIAMGAVIFLAGVVLQATAYSIAQICFGRFVSGFSIGVLSNAVPLYQSEVAPKEWRGAFGATYQLSITLGIAVSFWVDHIVNPNDNWGWRLAIWVQTLPCAVLFVGSLLAPSSPRWLMLQDRADEAKQALVRLRGSDRAAQVELVEITASVNQARVMGEVAWRSLFASTYVARLVFVGMTIMLLQQLCGMNAIMYYGTMIFGTMDLPETTFNNAIGAVNIVATIPGLLLMDRYGRVSLLRGSAIGMFTACVACGALGHAFILFPAGCAGPDCLQRATVSSHMAGMCIVFSICLFVASFACGWGPAAWVYCAEIFPLRYRSAALGTVTTTMWVGNYLIAHFTPILLEAIGFYTFFVFAFFCGWAALLSAWLPETRGVGLENMATVFEAKLGASWDCEDAASRKLLGGEGVLAGKPEGAGTAPTTYGATRI